LFLTFAKIEAAREKEAYLAVARGDVAKLPHVKGVYLTFGEHDIVLIHEAPSLSEAVRTAAEPGSQGRLSGLVCQRGGRPLDSHGIL